MTQIEPPLATTLARRFVMIASLVLGVNLVIVGAYYGTDRRALAAEAANNQAERVEGALVGQTLPAEARLRAFYARHSNAYAFALIDRSGEIVDQVNQHLIPPGATDILADNWITQIDRAGSPMTIAGHEFADRDDGLRMVFVMAGDPARLVLWAFLDEFYEHVLLPIFPLAVLLIVTGTILIRRGLKPLAQASAWARQVEPGALEPPPPFDRLPMEVADMVDATQRSLDRLSEALDAEKRLAAEAAHALRTPVAVLVARLDALPPGETTDILRGDLADLSRTVRQVLAASRADGLRVSRASALDLREAAEATTAALAPFAFEKGVELALDLPSDPVLARAEPEAVELALTNLIENAILHGGPGSVDIAVGPGPEISVRDRGPGLPPDARDRLFEAFWRAPGAVPGGTGLGLAIVDRVQRAQGGSVEARNAEGGGAVFRLVFPRA